MRWASYKERVDLPSSKSDFWGGVDVPTFCDSPRASSMHSIRSGAPPRRDRRCAARASRRTTQHRAARPETFSRESLAEKLEESPEGRIDCVRCELVPPPKPAQRAHTTGGLVRRRVSALHTAPDHGEGAHPHSRTLQQLCLRGLRSWFRDPHDVMIEAPENNEISTRAGAPEPARGTRATKYVGREAR